MKWASAKIGDALYDLSHLHPFSFEFVVAAKAGKPAQRYEIGVIFSVHCFTRKLRPGETFAGEWSYSDSRETRLFDQDRYRRSLQLPAIIRTIGDRKCFHTAHSNFFTIELIDAHGRAEEYTVYFKLSRAPARGRLNLYVQSAYMQNDIPQARAKPRRPIRFSVIAFNVAAGKPIRAPR